MTNKEKISIRMKKYYQANKERFIIEKREYRKNNKEKIAANNKKWREANKEKLIIEKREYRENNKEKINIRKKAYYILNKDKIAANNKKWREANKEKLIVKRKTYYELNKHKINFKRRELYTSNKDKIDANNKKWRETNKEKLIVISKEYQKKNMKKIIMYNKVYIMKRRKVDPIFKLKINIRRTIYEAFKKKGLTKPSRTKDILGVKSWEFFTQYLYQTFKKNYNEVYDPKVHKVHIDHIIPISSAKTEKDVIKLNHYDNLQLLKAKDNLKKSNKMDWTLPNSNLKDID